VQLHSDLVTVALELESGSGMRGCSFSLESSELLVETVVAPRRARTLYDSDHSTGKPKEHRVCTHTRLHDEEAAH
jgi:hypothetical protein